MRQIEAWTDLVVHAAATGITRRLLPDRQRWRACRKRMGRDHLIVHGFRSRFKDWAAQKHPLPTRGLGSRAGARHPRPDRSGLCPRQPVRQSRRIDVGLCGVSDAAFAGIAAYGRRDGLPHMVNRRTARKDATTCSLAGGMHASTRYSPLRIGARQARASDESDSHLALCQLPWSGVRSCRPYLLLVLYPLPG